MEGRQQNCKNHHELEMSSEQPILSHAMKPSISHACLLALILLSSCGEPVTFEHDNPHDSSNPEFFVRAPSVVTIVPSTFGVGLRIRSPQANVDSIDIEKSADGGEFRYLATIPFLPDVTYADTGRITGHMEYRFRNRKETSSGPMISSPLEFRILTDLLLVYSLRIHPQISSNRPGVQLTVDARAPSFTTLRIRLVRDNLDQAYVLNRKGNPSQGPIVSYYYNDHVVVRSTMPSSVKAVIESVIILPGRDSVLASQETAFATLPLGKIVYTKTTDAN
jgi:hypothetical protein